MKGFYIKLYYTKLVFVNQNKNNVLKKLVLFIQKMENSSFANTIIFKS